MVRLSIGRKLWIGVLTSAVFLLAVAATSIWTLRQTAATLEDVYAKKTLPESYLTSLSTEIRNAQYRVSMVLLEKITDLGSLNHLISIREEVPRFWHAFKAVHATEEEATDEERRLIAQIDAGMPILTTLLADLETAYRNGDRERLAQTLEEDWIAVRLQVINPLGELLPIQRNQTRAIYEKARQVAQRMAQVTTTIAVVGIAFFGAFVFWLLGYINRNLSLISTNLRRIADGDLTAEVRAERDDDEIGQMVASLNQTLSRLKEDRQEIADLLERNDQILNSVGEGIYGTDTHGRISFVNPACVRLTGYSVDELIGQNSHDLLHYHYPDGRPYPRSDCPLYRTYRDGLTHLSAEEVFWRKDGSAMPVIYTSTPVREASGELTGAVVSFTDISERKRFEASIRDREELLQSITAAAHDAIILIDEQGLVSFWNEAAATTFGWSAEEVMGQPLSGFIIPPAQREAHRAGLTKYAESGEGGIVGRVVEMNALRRDGTEFPAGIAISRIRLKGRWHAVGMVRDITERREREAELTRNYEDLKRLNKRLEDAQNQLLQSEKLASIGQLAAGVAHEINNPIGFVNSNLGTLSNYVADLFRLIDAYGRAKAGLAPGPERDEIEQREKEMDLDYLKDDTESLMRETLDGIARVRKIVQDLKDFSRAGSNEDWTSVDLLAGIDSTINVVWNELKYKCDLVREYTSLPEVRCLPSQLNQVWMNLLVNAAHAIEVKGRITVRTGQAGDEVWVEVEDTGKGIPAELLPRIFDPFFTTKPVGKGTGLGLSLTHGIIGRHGGRIDVTSEVGKGTTFRVTLPIHGPTGGQMDEARADDGPRRDDSEMTDNLVSG